MRFLAFIVRAGAVVAAIAAVAVWLNGGGPQPAAALPELEAATTTTPSPAKRSALAATRAKRSVPPGTVTIVATGDIVMGSTPNLPPGGGSSFFSDVEPDLAGDVVLGNLEGTLSTGGASKCGSGSTNCYAFQSPPSYAKWLKQAGFTVMNLANNHTYDFGRSGQQETIRALGAQDLLHTGRPGQITIQRVGPIRVALLGFAAYPWAQSLTDIAAAKRLVRKASERADVVVVTMHAGAEGTDKQNVRPGTEFYLGENRGNVKAFSRAVIDAGADLVVGHGPHVLRGMEWYKDRLIAYSLGNFGGYKVFALGGPLSVSGILRVTVDGAGRFESGILVPTQLDGSGIPALDPAERAHGVVRELSRQDFGASGASISPTGVIGR